jgi:hypothetical protein
VRPKKEVATLQRGLTLPYRSLLSPVEVLEASMRIGGMNMGQMNDGSECLVCELWQDLDSADDLDMCCKECREEIEWMLARRRAGDE